MYSSTALALLEDVVFRLAFFISALALYHLKNAIAVQANTSIRKDTFVQVTVVRKAGFDELFAAEVSG
jgi:hypothetical protein